MKKNRFVDDQISVILAEADRGAGTTGDVCRSHEVPEVTFSNWQERFQGMGVDEHRGTAF